MQLLTEIAEKTRCKSNHPTYPKLTLVSEWEDCMKGILFLKLSGSRPGSTARAEMTTAKVACASGPGVCLQMCMGAREGDGADRKSVV